MPRDQRKITAADIMPARDYAATRKARRAAIIPVKRDRRIQVGPFATFHFENYETMWLQVQEMLHIEKGGAEQVPGELDAYNPLIPQGHELIATLMLEIEDAARRDTELKRLGGIEETVSITVGEARIRATPTEYDDRTTADGKTSSVHWLRFVFTPDQIADFRGGARAVLEVDHPNYGHMAVIPPATRAALAGDFG